MCTTAQESKSSGFKIAWKWVTKNMIFAGVWTSYYINVKWNWNKHSHQSQKYPNPERKAHRLTSELEHTPLPSRTFWSHHDTNMANPGRGFDLRARHASVTLMSSHRPLACHTYWWHSLNEWVARIKTHVLLLSRKTKRIRASKQSLNQKPIRT